MFWSKSSCAAFLSNNDVNSPARVMFRGFPYDLPPWSVSILPDCKTEYYNTAKVRKERKLVCQEKLVILLIFKLN